LSRQRSTPDGNGRIVGIELAVLSAVAEYYRPLAQRGYASSPTIEKMAESARVRSIDISGAIKSLVARSLIAVVPGSGPVCK
jgi:hypothetical protein